MARKRRTGVGKIKPPVASKTCTTSEAGSSEDKDGPPAPQPSATEKPAATGRKKQTKEDQAPLLPTRTSSRVPKRIKRDISPPVSPCPPKKPAREHHPKASTSTPDAKKQKKPVRQRQGRERRPWEQWSLSDKSLFFEGLLEYGKDFDALTNFVATRQKKRLGLPPHMIKNKEQIRHFYYRTWHKVAKWITPNEEVKKQTQELYGLVNYNELRKHLKGGINDKTGPLLNDLVHKGTTQIRVRGKLHRLKTPMCRAMKRANGIEDPKDDGSTKLPQKVTLELRPRTNESWAYVQSLSHNPRLKMTVRLDKRLSSVVNFLEKKWRPHHLEIREQLKLTETPEKYIKIFPPVGCMIKQASLKVKPPPKKIDIALNSHVNNLKAIGYDPTAPVKKVPKGKQSSAKNQSAINMIPAVKNIQEDAVFPPAAIGAQRLVSQASTSSAGASTSGRLDFSNTVSFNGGVMEFTLNGVDKMMTDDKVDVDKICPIVTDISKDSIPSSRPGLIAKDSVPSSGPGLIANDGAPSAVSVPMPVPAASGKKDAKTAEKPSGNTTAASSEKLANNTSGAEPLNIGGLVEFVADKLDVVTFEQKFRAGWVLEDAKCVTLAEIYLALGNPQKIVLEYEWKDITLPKKAPVSTIPPEVLGHSSASIPICDTVPKRDDLAGLLRKLVQLATTEFVDLTKSKQSVSSSSPSRCTCGAILKNSGTPPGKAGNRSPGNSRSPSVSGQGKSPATPKGQGRRGSRAKKDKETLPKEQQPPSAARGSDKSTDPEAPKAPEPVFRVPLSVPAKAASYNSSQQTLINHNAKAVLANVAEEKNRAKQFIEQLDALSKRNGEGMMKRCRMRMRNVRKPMIVQRNILPKVLPQGQTMDPTTGQYVPIMTHNPLAGKTIVAKPLMSQSQMISGPHTLNRRPVLRKVGPSQTVTTADQSFYPSVPNSGSGNSLHAVARTLSVTSDNPLPPHSVSHAPVMSPLSVDVPREPHHIAPATMTSTSTPVLVKTESMPLVKTESLPLVKTELLPMVKTESLPLVRTESLIERAALESDMDISTPSISSLLNISIPGPEGGESRDVSVISDSADKFIDLALGSSTSFTDFLNNEKMSAQGLSSPPIQTEATSDLSVGQSPFKVDMTNWLQGEASCDVSLSSFLDSPVKKVSDPSSVTTQSIPFFCDNSRDSISSKFDSYQVDSMLQCMMNESSVDYGSKFADLAAQFAAVPDTHSETKK